MLHAVLLVPACDLAYLCAGVCVCVCVCACTREEENQIIS